jgi:Taurine catabolism dioxygenase TauD, TfdA family
MSTPTPAPALGLDPVRTPADPELVAGCLAEEATGRAGPATARLAQLLTGLVERHVDRRPGVGILSGLDGLDEPAARRFTLLASRTLGELAGQDAAGTLLREVRDRGLRLGEGRTGRYSDSRDGGNLHTDAPHVPGPPPDWFALFCLRQAPVGGGLLLVHVEDVLGRLDPATRAVLAGGFHFDRRQADARPPTVPRPILTASGGRTEIAYLREYVELGHRHEHVPDLTGEQRAALDALDAALADESLQLTGKLDPGELAVFDNRHVCHGRTAFTDDPRPGYDRLLLRTWIRRRASPGE